MKRLLAFLSVMLLLVSSAGAEEWNAPLAYAISMGMALDELAEDEEYLSQFMLYGVELEHIRHFAQGNRTAPCRVVTIDMSGEMECLAPQFGELPEAAQRALRNKLPMAMVNSLNGQRGTDEMFLSTILRVANVFVAPGMTGQGVWILYYEDASPVAVAWYAENNAILMEACPVSDAELMKGDAPLPVKEVVFTPPTLDASALALADELQTLARCESYLTNLSDDQAVIEGCRAFAAREGSEPIVCVRMDVSESPSPILYTEIGRKSVVELAAASTLQASVILPMTRRQG